MDGLSDFTDEGLVVWVADDFVRNQLPASNLVIFGQILRRILIEVQIVLQ